MPNSFIGRVPGSALGGSSTTSQSAESSSSVDTAVQDTELAATLPAFIKELTKLEDITTDDDHKNACVKYNRYTFMSGCSLFAVLSLVSVASVLSVASVGSILSIGSCFSLVSSSSILSVLSFNSVLAINCDNKFFMIC